MTAQISRACSCCASKVVALPAWQLWTVRSVLVLPHSFVGKLPRSSHRPLARFFNADGGSVLSRRGNHTQAAQQSLKLCHKCASKLDLTALSCTKCGCLQPIPSDVDYYELFGLQRETVPQGGWSLDAKALKAQWRKLMGVSHPDKMANKDDKEKQLAEQQSSLINKAYSTLLDPLSRAMYLLQLHAAAPVEEADSLEDPILLSQVMEMREGLDEAQDQSDVDSVREENRSHIRRTVDALAQAFGASPPDVATARKAAVELRYWINIDKAASEWSRPI